MEDEKMPTDNSMPDSIDETSLNESSLNSIRKNEKLSYTLKIIYFFVVPVISFFLVFAFILYFVPFLNEITPHGSTKITSSKELRKEASYKNEYNLLNKELQKISRKYNSYTTGQSYIVINTTMNRFSLYTNKKLIREGFCSSGSYKMLKASDGKKKWIFKTPKGKRHVQGKQTDPVWRRPDWAFVEEGLPIPKSQTDPSRYEYGVLGDYALSLGDGYMLHGTIYKRFLGMPVTHGCVRLNDEDLKVIFNTLSIGSKVYIF